MLDETTPDATTSTPVWRDRLLIAAAVVSVLLAVARWGLYALRGEVVPPYKLTLFWVDYRDGFVRRGLPGQVLSWLTGGSPTVLAATMFGVVLSAVAAGSVGWLAWALARCADRVAILALFVVSPLALPLLMRDLGRYDAVTVAMLVGAVIALGRLRWPLALPVAAGLLAVAAAAEEFSIAFAVPVVAVAVCSTRTRGPGKIVVAAAVLVPAAVVAALGLVTSPAPAALSARADAARTAGVKVSTLPSDDAATFLGASASEQAATFARYAPSTLVVTAVTAAALAIATGWVLWRLLGRPASTASAAAAVWLAPAAGGLSMLGVDFLRWWALAFLAFALVLYAVPRDRATTTSTVSPRVVLVAVAVSLLAADFPIEPSRLLAG